MKTLLSLFAIIALLVPIVVLGAISSAPDIPIETVLEKISGWLLGFLVAFATLMLIVAGFYFVTSQGDPEKIKKAKNFVLWALVGLGVGLLSTALVNFVQRMVK